MSEPDFETRSPNSKGHTLTPQARVLPHHLPMVAPDTASHGQRAKAGDNIQLEGPVEPGAGEGFVISF